MTLFEQEKYKEALKALQSGDINHIKEMVVDECERLRMPEELKKQLFNKFNIRENENDSNQLQRKEVVNRRGNDPRGIGLYDWGTEAILRKGSFGEPKRLINS